MSDGFDQTLVNEYEQVVADFPEVKSVKSIRGRMYGANVFLLILLLRWTKYLTVEKAHAVADAIEALLSDRFNVYDTDIHIETRLIADLFFKGHFVLCKLKNSVNTTFLACKHPVLLFIERMANYSYQKKKVGIVWRR